jgi:ribosomal protein L11 methyltransferase
MNYKQVSIKAADLSVQEILIALLSDQGYEGFEQKDDALMAFIPALDYDGGALNETLSAFDLDADIVDIEKRNWNEEWEQNFQPVIVADFCTVRADFHQIEVLTPHEIVITPKMSFGTGHHATTQLMITAMRDIGFDQKRVLDFGTGTGILAILASMLGAKGVVAVDNDEWSCENADENVKRNETEGIGIVQGSLEAAGTMPFDVILANINRHILLQYMTEMFQLLKGGGTIAMSGLLREDREIVTDAAVEAGFSFSGWNEMNNWIVLIFAR